MSDPYSIKSPAWMDEGVDGCVGSLDESLENFSLPFNSVMVIDSGRSALKARAVALSRSVAANALSLTLITSLSMA